MVRKIRVGMDISQLAHRGGVATYTQNLASQLFQIDDLEMVYLYFSLRKPYLGNLKNVKKYRLPPKLFEMLFNRWRNISIEKFLGFLDIFHSSDWTQPPSKAIKVTTVHDLVAIKYPEWSYPQIVDVHTRRLKLIEREIDCVIAVSESTKKDLMEVSKIPEKKIKVIYEGPTMNFQKASQIQIKEFREKYDLPQRFILAIGGIGERRNLERIKVASSGYHLVIAGQTIPWLNLDELGLLYQSASVLVYCSLYEGFGLPIVDAFYSGLAVITSKVSSMPEVAGDAALLADPYSVEDIQKKIKIVMEDTEMRRELIAKGSSRAKLFSWEKCAEQTAAVYRRLVK